MVKSLIITKTFIVIRLGKNFWKISTNTTKFFTHKKGRPTRVFVSVNNYKPIKREREKNQKSYDDPERDEKRTSRRGREGGRSSHETRSTAKEL